MKEFTVDLQSLAGQDVFVKFESSWISFSALGRLKLFNDELYSINYFHPTANYMHELVFPEAAIASGSYVDGTFCLELKEQLRLPTGE